VSKALTFSEDQIEEFQVKLKDSVFSSVSEDEYHNSVEFGEIVANEILAWASTDGYKETRGLRYTSFEEDGKWIPTPPAYINGIEPFWSTIRPFVLDSANQFKPVKSTEFSTQKGSRFYNEVMEVYQVSEGMSEEQKEIAAFWDCNPFVMNTLGHVMYATKKITPGGHWLGITQIANKNTNADIMKSLEAYTLVSVAIADGFIGSWDEKYRSNLIRPETVINAYIDEEWIPLLQTPPFPEYPSAHSVISKAASVVLTNLFSENFDFVDTSEEKYGLPARSFNSFQEAAEEAAISRLYGGIHYMPAIKNGLVQGEEIGKKVITTVKTKKGDNSHILDLSSVVKPKEF
jgi:hypothetical protein